ncbi:MAG: hypothetical protein ACUVX8_12560 [Candidatus Zipacnadales bacterium]
MALKVGKRQPRPSVCLREKRKQRGRVAILGKRYESKHSLFIISYSANSTYSVFDFSGEAKGAQGRLSTTYHYFFNTDEGATLLRVLSRRIPDLPPAGGFPPSVQIISAEFGEER